MRELSVLERTNRVLRAALGEEWYDDQRGIITDVVVGYAEPGYGSDESVVVLGNYNTRSTYNNPAPLTKDERLPARLGDALEHAGAEIEWLDEWYRCTECGRAFRTEPDSYSWRMFGILANDCEPVCGDCLLEDVNGYLDSEGFVNDSSRCVTWADASDLRAAGWVQWEPGDEQRYQSGWHEGMTDDPTEVAAQIAQAQPSADVVFLLDESSQFYVSFSAWIREECPTCGPLDDPNCFTECVCECHDRD